MENLELTTSSELSEQELAEFLNEIEDEDNIINTQEKQALNEITNLDKSLGDLYENTRFAQKKRPSEELQRKKIISEASIKRFAFNQNIIDLSAKIPKTHFRTLITLLTSQHTFIIERYKAYINRRLEKLLLKQMPGPIKNCWKLYPQIMRVSPGFLYKACFNNKNYIFWANPGIPAYFKQHCERDVLVKTNPAAIEVLDKAIKKYHTYVRNKQKREIRFAEIFIRNNIKTYLDLLKFKPIMWEMLYNYLKERSNE